jgi:hypothetical protein
MALFEVNIKRKGLDNLLREFPKYVTSVKKDSQRSITKTAETLLENCFNEAYDNTPFKHATGRYKSMVRIERDDWRRISLIAGAKYSDVIEKCRPYITQGHHILERTYKLFIPELRNNIKIIEKNILKKKRSKLKKR